MGRNPLTAAENLPLYGPSKESKAMMNRLRTTTSAVLLSVSTLALPVMAHAQQGSPVPPAKTTPKPGAAIAKPGVKLTRPGGKPAKPGGGLGDGITAQKVRSKLITDLRFDPSGIKVVSSSGVVALNGAVATAQARAWAQADALKAPQVRRVINRLKIVP